MYFTSTGLVILYTRHLGSGRPRCIGGVPRAGRRFVFIYVLLQHYEVQSRSRNSAGRDTMRRAPQRAPHASDLHSLTPRAASKVLHRTLAFRHSRLRVPTLRAVPF